MPVVTTWHKLQIGLYIWSVGVFLPLRETMHGPWPSKVHTRCEQGIDANEAYASDLALGIWCRWVSRGKTVPERVWSLGVDNGTRLSAGVPPLHLGWRLE